MVGGIDHDIIGCESFPIQGAKIVPKMTETKESSKQSVTKQKPRKKVLKGHLSVHAKGFGFVTVKKGTDVFIPLENLHNAMDGDLVSVEIIKNVPKKNPKGKIINILTLHHQEIIGVFKREKEGGSVVPSDERYTTPIAIPHESLPHPIPKNGDFVVVKRTNWDEHTHHFSGKIIDILGKPGNKGMDILMVARNNDLTIPFPKSVTKELSTLADYDIQKEAKNREDFRSIPCFTIDPKSARDFDDAISLVQLENGRFELGVHIADVSHYVTEGSAIDREAYARGTSVYFVNNVIPMLPERLSNDLCSLKPQTDRLAYSVIMEIDSRGIVQKYRIRETIIRSAVRFTYEEVETIIQGKQHPYAKTIHLMVMLSLILRKEREERGSIDFDISEPAISLDAQGVPYAIRPRERIESNRLIEEFMLVANRIVAEHIASQATKRTQKPFVYRVHQKPEESSVRSFLELLERMGLKYQLGKELESDDYRKILDIIENFDYKYFIEKVALRSMTKAYYSTKNEGHFGLAFDAYTHFTSPIRRYPDLVVHRLLKFYAEQERNKKRLSKSEISELSTKLQEACKHCSQREIRTTQAEREFIKLKSMEFLSSKVGESYDGVISGIASFGMFVELSHYVIEGLIHISELKGDHFHFDKEEYTLTGKNTGKVYRVGDTVKIKIKSVSKEEKRADFLLV
jgi:ribonuclease R